MPSDLKSGTRDHTIMVVDSLGLKFPFSRGIMASSILATGAETPVAYHIAQLIQDELLHKQNGETTSTALTELTTNIIKGQLGESYAVLFSQWQKIKNSGRPIVISLSAASGIGKSTLATRLSLRLGINRVVTTDSVREVLRTVIPDAVSPDLHVSSFETLPNQLSNDHLSTFQRQSHAVGAASAAVAKRYIMEKKNIIIEGVHLLPGEMTEKLKGIKDNPIVVELFLSLSNRDRHKNQLIHRSAHESSRNGNNNIEKFDRIRDIQSHLKNVALDHGIPEYDLETNEDLTQKVIKLIIDKSAVA